MFCGLILNEWTIGANGSFIKAEDIGFRRPLPHMSALWSHKYWVAFLDFHRPDLLDLMEKVYPTVAFIMDSALSPGSVVSDSHSIRPGSRCLACWLQHKTCIPYGKPNLDRIPHPSNSLNCCSPLNLHTCYLCVVQTPVLCFFLAFSPDPMLGRNGIFKVWCLIWGPMLNWSLP